jgi:small subunit ribosomal protein S18
MARNNDRDRDRGRRAAKDTRPARGKKKICIFCAGKVEWVDYKDINTLRRFTSDRGKIRARRVTGNCSQHQRDVAVAIKTARELALLPYAQRTVSERGPGRGRGERGERPPRPDVTAEAEPTEDVTEGADFEESDDEDALESVGEA